MKKTTDSSGTRKFSIWEKIVRAVSWKNFQLSFIQSEWEMVFKVFYALNITWKHFLVVQCFILWWRLIQNYNKILFLVLLAVFLMIWIMNYNIKKIYLIGTFYIGFKRLLSVLFATKSFIIKNTISSSNPNLGHVVTIWICHYDINPHNLAGCTWIILELISWKFSNMCYIMQWLSTTKEFSLGTFTFKCCKTKTSLGLFWMIITVIMYLS